MIDAGILEANATTGGVEIAGLLVFLLVIAYVAEALDVWQVRSRSSDASRNRSRRRA